MGRFFNKLFDSTYFVAYNFIRQIFNQHELEMNFP